MSEVSKRRAEVFRFCGCDFDEGSLTASFYYKFEFEDGEEMDFVEKIVFPEVSEGYDERLFEKVLESVQVILGISYFKLYFPRRVEVDFLISQKAADFWNAVYEGGLGEYLCVNGLDRGDLAKFVGGDVEDEVVDGVDLEGILLGIGGGKDSIVAGELLKDFDFEGFVIETQREDEICARVLERMGRECVKVKRVLDPKIFEKREDGFNGHVPISAVFAFVGLLSCVYYGKKYVVVGNEHSSNFGNVDYQGKMINHQWSKSMEYEELLADYLRSCVSKDLGYFSVLRQFYEIRIVQMFSDMEEYFDVFSSCNRSFRVFKERSGELWCRECSKCAFVFLMLAAFLEKERLVGIFGGNMLNDESLVDLYKDLCGFGDLKPFDCVGTFEESKVAMKMAAERFGEDVVVKEVLPMLGDDLEDLKRKVFMTERSSVLQTEFKLLGVKKVGILGYGKEGKVSERFLKRWYPHLEIGILDQSVDENYMDLQEEYDLLVKTPGIPKRMVRRPYVTGTNLFFSRVKNLVVGVTGSKGKSTTCGLIYEMIKASGRKVSMLGNMGNPMLEYLLQDVDEEEVLVVELSSYMLDDIEFSPQISLLINLFPEHMDYHGGVENYFAAKRNIFKFQSKGDVAVEGPFEAELPMKEEEIPLLGKHNLSNVRAAAEVVRHLGVNDEAIRAGVLNFKSLPHRLEFVGEFEGVRFYDDAISTTPQSTIEAIKAVGNVDTIFLGGTDRGYDFGGLEECLREFGVKNVVLFPDSGERILSSREGFVVLETDDMAEAVKFAFEKTAKGKTCLLSTASPSYSLWKNFEEKGDLFQDLVRKY